MGSQKVAAATNSEYKALDAVPVNCDSGTMDYNSDLPRWDPEYSEEEDFYNACYYSFRCCTTTGNGNGCYVSDNFGAMCRSCIKDDGPRFVKKACVDFLSDGELTPDQKALYHGRPHRRQRRAADQDPAVRRRVRELPRQAVGGQRQRRLSLLLAAARCGRQAGHRLRREVLRGALLVQPALPARHPADRRPRHVQALHTLRLPGRLLGH